MNSNNQSNPNSFHLKLNLSIEAPFSPKPDTVLLERWNSSSSSHKDQMLNEKSSSSGSFSFSNNQNSFSKASCGQDLKQSAEKSNFLQQTHLANSELSFSADFNNLKKTQYAELTGKAQIAEINGSKEHVGDLLSGASLKLEEQKGEEEEESKEALEKREKGASTSGMLEYLDYVANFNFKMHSKIPSFQLSASSFQSSFSFSKGAPIGLSPFSREEEEEEESLLLDFPFGEIDELDEFLASKKGDMGIYYIGTDDGKPKKVPFDLKKPNIKMTTTLIGQPYPTTRIDYIFKEGLYSSPKNSIIPDIMLGREVPQRLTVENNGLLVNGHCSVQPNDINLSSQDRRVSRIHARLITRFAFSREIPSNFLAVLMALHPRSNSLLSKLGPDLIRHILEFLKEPAAIYIVDLGSQFGTYMAITEENCLLNEQTYLAGTESFIEVSSVEREKLKIKAKTHQEVSECFEFKAPASGMQVWSIGRGKECDVILKSKGVSRKHAVIKWQEGQWSIKDEGSANGTWVGISTRTERENHRETRPIQVSSKSIIKIADAIIRFDFSAHPQLTKA